MTLAIVVLIGLVFACYAASRSAAAAKIMRRLMIIASALWLIVCGILEIAGGDMPAGQFIGLAMLPIAACWAFVIALLWAVAPRGF